PLVPDRRRRCPPRAWRAATYSSSRPRNRRALPGRAPRPGRGWRPPRARRPPLRPTREIHALAPEIADLPHQHQPGPASDQPSEFVEGQVVVMGSQHASLHPPLLEDGRGIDRGRVLEIREDNVVARAPGHRSHRLIQALGGMAEKGDARSLHAKHAGHPRLRAIVAGEELLAAAHASALEGAHASGNLVVRPEPRRLAARGQMGDPLETDELALVEEGHGGGPQAGRVSRAAAPAAWSSTSGVSGLMEQSGPRRSQRPFISAMAWRARAASASVVAEPMPGVAGEAPPTPPPRPPAP